MKKYKFKNIVRSSCQDVAFRELKNKTKEKNLTKIKKLKYVTFYQNIMLNEWWIAYLPNALSLK